MVTVLVLLCVEGGLRMHLCLEHSYLKPLRSWYVIPAHSGMSLPRTVGALLASISLDAGFDDVSKLVVLVLLRACGVREDVFLELLATAVVSVVVANQLSAASFRVSGWFLPSRISSAL